MTVENDAGLALIDKMMTDPRTRKPFLNLVKTHNPNVVIPEIDSARPIEQALGQLKQGILAVNQKIENDKIDRFHNQKRAELKSKHGYTDEGIAKLEGFMANHNIAEHDIAHKAYQAMQPPKMAQPSFRPQRFFDEQRTGDKEWFENPERALDQELTAVFTEIANGTLAQQ